MAATAPPASPLQQPAKPFRQQEAGYAAVSASAVGPLAHHMEGMHSRSAGFSSQPGPMQLDVVPSAHQHSAASAPGAALQQTHRSSSPSPQALTDKAAIVPGGTQGHTALLLLQRQLACQQQQQQQLEEP